MRQTKGQQQTAELAKMEAQLEEAVQAMSTPVQVKVLSPIAWAKKHGKASQLVYSWLRENKVPENCIYRDAVTSKVLLIEDEMDAWFEARQVANANKPKALSHGNPLALLGLMVEWFDMAGRNDIADDLKKVYDVELAKQTPAEEPEAKTEVVEESTPVVEEEAPVVEEKPADEVE